MKRLIPILLALLLLAACGTGGQAPDPESESSSSPSSKSIAVAAPSHPPEGEKKPLYFSLGPEGEVKALYTGDALGDWTLEDYSAVWDEGTDGVPWVYSAFFDAPADAPIELRCEVYLSPMASEERVYFFDVMPEDYGKLPVMEGTNSRLWFGSGASDALGALEALEPDERWDCRVAVSRYDYCHLAMEAYDVADIAWLEVESTTTEPPVPDGQPSGPFLSEDGLILPPPVPHSLALDGIDFSTLDKTGIVSLLRPVLERARFFCKFGMSGEIDDAIGVTIDFSPEAAIQRPHPSTGIERDLHPCLNLSYRTIEELKQDMCTVFTPNISEDGGYLWYIFQNMTDYDGRIYVYGGGGYSRERFWELDKMEIVSAEKTKLTISAPVSAWGPSGEVFTAQLNVEIVDGYLIMDDSYFADNAS